MFFKSDAGVNIIQFGSGDIEIGGSTVLGSPEVGAVSLVPLENPIEPNSDIDRSKEEAAGMTDEEIGVHTRLVFTDTRSIDALVYALGRAKEYMESAIQEVE